MEAISSGRKTILEITVDHAIHPIQMSQSSTISVTAGSTSLKTSPESYSLMVSESLKRRAAIKSPVHSVHA